MSGWGRWAAGGNLARGVYEWSSFFFTCGTFEWAPVSPESWEEDLALDVPSRGSPRPPVSVHSGGTEAESPASGREFLPCWAADHCGPVLAMPLSFQEGQELTPLTCCTQKSYLEAKPTH